MENCGKIFLSESTQFLRFVHCKIFGENQTQIIFVSLEYENYSEGTATKFHMEFHNQIVSEVLGSLLNGKNFWSKNFWKICVPLQWHRPFRYLNGQFELWTHFT